MTLPHLKLKTILDALVTPYPDVIRLNTDADSHPLKIVDGVILVRPLDHVYTIHEVGHFLTRDPAVYFALNVPKLNYGFRAPTSFEGMMRMMRNELSAFAITDVLWQHLAGKTFEPYKDAAEIRVRLLCNFVKATWPAAQIDRMNFADRINLYSLYRSWLHQGDDLLWWWDETVRTLRRMAQAARAISASSDHGEPAPSLAA